MAAKVKKEPAPSQRFLEDFAFVGFNSRVAALDRNTGERVWDWKASNGSGFVAVLLDGDRLIVSVQGYTYCLAALTGKQLWYNALDGMGVGVPCLASIRGSTHLAAHAYLQEQDGASASASVGAASV
ncbi:MAG TPA: PQQ-binding-like beta-propeller repeat protein [Pirellulales bacterium]|nr:PQQ-binding-like beta-propeller repeat protein [Pirellulales bacterium]